MTGPARGAAGPPARLDLPVVHAAGGLVHRPGPSGPEVLVVHRPAPRDDWSLPKGKLDPGERHREAALREVHEETGVRCRLLTRICEVRYPTVRGEDKRVRWWLMEPLADDGFTPDHEVDVRRWVPVGELDALLTWDLDRAVVHLSVTSGLLDADHSP